MSQLYHAGLGSRGLYCGVLNTPLSTALPPPGSPRQQSLLQTIAACHDNDSRILAALIFGSLARGNWDIFSDLDLAVVVRDGLQIDIPGEYYRVSAALAA